MSFEDKLEVIVNDVDFLFVLVELMCEITLFKRIEGLSKFGLSRVHEDYLTNILVHYQEGDILTNKQIDRTKKIILFYKTQIKNYITNNDYLYKQFKKVYKSNLKNMNNKNTS